VTATLMLPAAPPRTLGPAVAAFLRGNCRHTKGPKIGQPLALDGWQEHDLALIYEMDERGRRVWRDVMWGIPRGNGKSPIAAGVGLFELTDRDDAPEIYCAAGAKSQAKFVHDPARAFVENGPLSDYLSVYRNSITKALGGYMQLVSADGDLQHGGSTSAALCDEFHVWRTPKQCEVFYAFASATQKRADSMLLKITTAGKHADALAALQYAAAIERMELERHDVLRRGDGCLLIGRNRDAGQLMIWRGAPEDADAEDPLIWRACNPASWIDLDEIRRLAATLPESVFRRLILNQFGAADNRSISAARWDGCAGPVEIPAGASVAVGVSLSGTGETGTGCVCWPREHDAWEVEFRRFEAEDDCADAVQEWLLDVAGRYRVEAFAYPPAQLAVVADNVRAAGVSPWSAPTRQAEGWFWGDALMVPASRELLTKISRRGLRQSADGHVRAEVLAALAVDRRDGWRMTAPGRDQEGEVVHAEAAFALLMAVTAAQGVLDAGDGWIEFWS